MGGHGHGPPYTVPHYSQFTVKGIPQLDELEKALAVKGLKDPWIRNEAWRYHPGFGTRWQRARKFFFRGFPIGLGLTVITVALDKFMGGGEHGHGHGHEGEH
ncbi:NADH dehydrogenase [ubiquinone] 1 beta subcomplex subunit 3 [Bombyx mandarina]|uniref:NADH dehydrogenase [ubiquinone] 1 beta subcomplex subunit 3 n=2 Tax=Bombyx TaxID=7090 RepID=A0A8R1WKH5_BOMMO|nr:NADH dehydrogenase [ubiquinone] 1 beta subcomplex subunit 3 [Bombyx mori]XP_004927328.1 NADH dehydrogenase [ubiquinone] 1 beta subcomplex subunit 3 [Bombyx mori]XP_004927329.1 NADH dehydrogenase [ubiquinone] 1 beta subcomplex subunit 3 [Bombyx mori]XP_028038810.1 NADH dehydrogenase [ubiquinone] 1 beta subcomplex subunit 3 [Bombyx mandarina]XP_028038811.1 NADH dehydrogenase [ubiquinone] 1 beta subcomplex subunit 3 [Bombyx mandarina]XP_028038812.1 NADH dehydrogenase [ubiquinone] 1 beta subcom